MVPMEAARPTEVAGKNVLVVGLGRFGGGVGVTRWLVESDARVTVTDLADAAALAESINSLADLPVTFHLGGHDLADLDAIDLVVINPAVNKAASFFFQEVVRRRLPWTTELNLFCERCRADVIGITGTYGKSTTCVMVADVLRAWISDASTEYTNVHLGGNIGRSLLPRLGEIRASDVVVLEMSNAQLEDLPKIRWAPCVAVVTNLSPNHLERYAGFSQYVGAKLNIVRDPLASSRIIVGPVDPRAEPMIVAAVGGDGSRIVRVGSPEKRFDLLVPGAHNQSNAACAAAICRSLGVDESMIRTGLARFEGLPHRIQFVRSLGGVAHFNDSKATTPAATTVAVTTLDRPIVLIVGGKRMDRALGECATILAKRCRVVVCVGASGPEWADALRGAAATSDGPIVTTTAKLPEAVQTARSLAIEGDTVLFSPGAPSFDAYANYAERGSHFIALVEALD